MDYILKAIAPIFILITAFAGMAASVDENLINGIKPAYERPKEVPFTPGNPPTKEKEILGRLLFFDPRISGSKLLSCASCHNPSLAWGDSLAKGVGHKHQSLSRRTPTILNLAWAPKLFWDGRASDLEEQALGPIAAEGEMNMSLEGKAGLIETLNGMKEYKAHFEKAFPGEKTPITTKNVGKAIATFERTIISGQAPFDKFVGGDDKAISDSAKRGFALFNTKARCLTCHTGWNFTDHGFHDIGVNDSDIGRGKFIKDASQQHTFKTPGLRNIDRRGPYMHDGSEKTLEDVVEFYNKGGIARRASLSPLIQPLGLNKKEKQDLVDFLKTLTSEDAPQTLPVLPR